MAINIGYLTANKTSAGDEVYTPFYAVEPLMEFLPKDKKIWSPFDEEWSAFYQYLTEQGFDVERSSFRTIFVWHKCMLQRTCHAVRQR